MPQFDRASGRSSSMRETGNLSTFRGYLRPSATRHTCCRDQRFEATVTTLSVPSSIMPPERHRSAPELWHILRNWVMAGRTTRMSVTFSSPFSLVDVDGIQPAGTYRIQTADVTLDNLSFLAYRRVSTTIEVPGVGAASSRRQVVTIDPLELEAALKRDRPGNAEGSRTIATQVI